jgi:CMP-N-acetylneuraminic acid synthetase
MDTLIIIMARAGSSGLPDKCILPLCGRPIIAHTISHALQSKLADDIILTTDSRRAAQIAKAAGVTVIDRPACLATDTASVGSVLTHGTAEYEARNGCTVKRVVCLYGNVPVRADEIVDRCIEHHIQTGCDSVRTVAPVSKQHPDWIHRLECGDSMVQFRENKIDRRQELEPLFYVDGSVFVVKRDGVFHPDRDHDPHIMFGTDRRAIVQDPEDTVDIDTLTDFYLAEAILRVRNESVIIDRPTAATRRPVISAGVSYAAYERS